MLFLDCFAFIAIIVCILLFGITRLRLSWEWIKNRLYICESNLPNLNGKKKALFSLNEVIQQSQGHKNGENSM